MKIGAGIGAMFLFCFRKDGLGSGIGDLLTEAPFYPPSGLS